MEVSPLKTRLLIALIFLGIFSVLVLLFFVYLWNVPDDTFISFTYAKNYIQGNGLTYNGILVEGYSNFLWVLIVSVFLRIGVDPLWGARAVSFGSLVASLWIMDKILRTLAPKCTRLQRVVLCLLFITNVSVLFWTVSGLETVFLMLLVNSLVFLELRPHTSLSLKSALLALLCTLTRPESIIVVPMVVASHFAISRRHDPTELRRYARWLLMVGLPYLAYLGWRYSFYGALLPNSVNAKVQLQNGPMLKGLDYFLGFFVLHPVVTLLLIATTIGLMAGWAKLQRSWSVVIVFVLGYSALVVIAGHDYMLYHRYMVPFLALIYLMAFAGLSSVGNRGRIFGSSMVTIGIIGIFFEIFLTATLFFRSPLPLDPAMTPREMGLWLKENTPPGEVVAVVDAGNLAYWSELPLIDIFGINDTYLGCDVPFDFDYVFSHRPYFIELHAIWSEEKKLWIAPPKDVQILIFEHPTFIRCYRPVLIGERETDPVVFQREDGCLPLDYQPDPRYLGDVSR